MRPSSNHHHSGYGSGNHHGSRNSNGMTGSNDFFGHDPMTAINNFDHDRHQSSLSNLPIPVGKLHYCLFFSNLFSSFPVSNFHDEKLVKIASRAKLNNNVVKIHDALAGWSVILQSAIDTTIINPNTV